MASTLNYLLRVLQNHNKDGSYATQSNRRAMLEQAATDLREMGYRRMDPKSLKPKHVSALVERWKSKSLSPGTMKNRMSAIRWWAERVGKLQCIQSNTELGIEKRILVSSNDVNEAKSLDESVLDKVTDQNIRLALQLQEHFGLRREEALKFTPKWAIREDKIVLKSSWAKGGKEREIIITTAAQRKLLNKFDRFHTKESLIPSNLSYKEGLNRYENQCANAGLNKCHGLRYRYAQERFEVLADYECPRSGGRSRSEMTSKEREFDDAIRQIISRELGHERISITAVYLGS